MNRKESRSVTERAKELQWLIFHRDEQIDKLVTKTNGELKKASLEDFITFWEQAMKDSREIRKETLSNYRNALNDLFEKGILPEMEAAGGIYTMDCFIFERDRLSQAIQDSLHWTENEKRLRINALVCLSKFLSVVSCDVFSPLELPKKYILKDVRGTSSPSVLTLKEWGYFREELQKISLRDFLIATLMYFTARPLSRVLDLEKGHIDLEKRLVFFPKGSSSASDSRLGLERVRFDSEIERYLRQYIEESSSYRGDACDAFFITSRGKSVYRTHLNQVFERASSAAKLDFKVTAKMIQWSYVADRLSRCKFPKWKLLKMLDLEKIPKNLEV